MKIKYRMFAALVIMLLAGTLLTGFGTIKSETASTAGSNVDGGIPKTLRVGMECAYAPFNWTQNDDSNGAVPLGDGTYAGGYDVEIAKLLAEQLGCELQVVKTEWDGLPPSLTSGKIDAIIAGMSNTAERRQTIAFTDKYYTSDMVIVVQKDSPFAGATSLADFSGAKLTSQMGTFNYELIDQITGVQKQEAMKDFPTMTAALTSGRIDGYVSERPGALSAQASNPSLTFVAFEGDKGFDYDAEQVTIAIGLRQEDGELKDALNKALATIGEDKRKELMDNAVKNQPLDTEGAEGEATAERGFFGWIVFLLQEYGMQYLKGTGLTILLAIVGTLAGLLIGLLVGIVRTIPLHRAGQTRTTLRSVLLRIVNSVLAVYIEIFRGTPMMVQAMLIYYGLTEFAGISIDKIPAAFIIITLNTGAYMAEIVRGGIHSVDCGQKEAAEAIGMTHWQTMTSIVLPQTIRNILPATGNEFVVNLKDSSVLSVIMVSELFYATSITRAVYYRTYEPFVIAAAIYLTLTFVSSRLLRLLEKHLDGPQSYTLASSTMPLKRPGRR